MADIRSDVRRLILDLKNPDKWDYTGYVTLDVVDGKRWAIVIGWMDGFDDEGTADYKRDDYRLCGKVAYQSTHSVMQEYDYDWLMPYDEESGEVWDTDASIDSDSNIDSCIDWWLSEWEEIKKIYVYPEEEDYDKDIESATKINCVGHNDPGRYFDLIDYFDVWGNEEDGWEVNDQTVVEEKIWISDDTTEEELFNYLKDTVGYFNRNTKFSDVEIQWYDPDFIEIFQAKDGCPVCSLRKSYTR